MTMICSVRKCLLNSVSKLRCPVRVIRIMIMMRVMMMICDGRNQTFNFHTSIDRW